MCGLSSWNPLAIVRGTETIFVRTVQVPVHYPLPLTVRLCRPWNHFVMSDAGNSGCVSMALEVYPLLCASFALMFWLQNKWWHRQKAEAFWWWSFAFICKSEDWLKVWGRVFSPGLPLSPPSFHSLALSLSLSLSHSLCCISEQHWKLDHDRVTILKHIPLSWLH